MQTNTLLTVLNHSVSSLVMHEETDFGTWPIDALLGALKYQSLKIHCSQMFLFISGVCDMSFLLAAGTWKNLNRGFSYVKNF